MLQLFMSHDNTNYPIKSYSRMDYIRRRCQYELDRIMNYYYNREASTNNNHLISRLVHNLSDTYNIDPMKVYREVNNNKDYVARVMKITSDISFGEVHNNILYKNNSKEVFVSVDNFINPYTFREKWMDYVPIRVVYTDELNIDFYNFDGSKEKQEESITVVEIDINILMLMYNYWSLERLKNDKSTNTNTFVKTVVLPKMMGSCLDLTIWNRYINIFYNNDMYLGYSQHHPFHVIDFRNEIDNILRKIVKDTSNVNMDFNNLINYVPTIYNNKMINTLLLNRSYYTRQSEWTIWASRIKYIEAILDIAGSAGIRRNTSDVSKLPQYIRLLENGSTPIGTMLSGKVKNDFFNTIEKLKSKLGKR